MRHRPLKLPVAPAALLSFLAGAVSVMLLLGPAGVTPAAAKSYRHTSLEQTVVLLDDGRLQVADVRAWAFDGSFSAAFLTVEPASGGTVEFEGVEPADGGQLRDAQVDGHTLNWGYSAQDETRVFRVRYVLTGEVTRATDAALIDRQFLEQTHAPVDDYLLTLVLPRPASLLKVFVFTASGRTGTLDVQPEAGRAVVRMSSIGADEWVRFRILVDPDQVPGVAMESGPRYQAWLDQTAAETSVHREATRRWLERHTPRMPLPTALAPILAVVAGLFCFGCWRVYRSHGIEPVVGEVGEYFREPAEEIPPAAVPFIIEQISPGVTAGPPALGATLLDFARRGFLQLVERRKEGFLGIGAGSDVDFQIARRPAAGELASFEHSVWEMLEDARKDDDTVTPKELKRYFERHRMWLQEWCREPRSWYETTRSPLLAESFGGRMALMILASMGLTWGIILVGAFSANPIVLAVAIPSGVLAGIFGIVSALSLPRWRAEALLRARKWKAYRRFLSDFSAMEDSPAEHYKLWDYHFVYATALGVAKKYLANLKKLMTLHPEQFTTPAWLVAAGSQNSGLNALSGLSLAQANIESIQHNLAALESALTTSTTAGGGFSGGGVGGSSGGGGASGAH